MTVAVAAPLVPVAGNEDLGALITFTSQGAGTTGSAILNTPNDVRGIKIVINITLATTATLTVTLRGYDRASGATYTILASAALAATGLTVLTVYPGLTAAANTVANDHLPAQWDVSAAITGTISATI